MNTAQPNNLEKLITLKEASEKLNVSIEMLLSWNQHNILKPTITQNGEIGYTPAQFNQFLIIKHTTQQLEMKIAQPLIVEQQTISEAPHTSRIHGAKHSYSKPLLTFSVIVFLITIALLPKPEGVAPYQYQQTYQNLSNDQDVLSTRTSRLNISKQISALPIQLKSDDKSNSIFKEKKTAPELYKQKVGNDETTDSVTIAQKPTFQGDVNLDEVGNNTYASVGYFQNSQADDSSAIDDQGKIRGDANIDTISAVVGNLDQMLKNGSLSRGTTDANNQLLLVTLGALAVLFALQKQFAFINPTKKPMVPHVTPLQFATPLSEKVFEIDQKTDGTVVLIALGKEYKISKPEMNSESDQFIEKLMQLSQSNVQEIEFDSLITDKSRFTTPLSRLVTRLGFVGVKRDLFFPRTSKNSVLFRRYLTQQDLDGMNKTSNQILNELNLLS